MLSSQYYGAYLHGRIAVMNGLRLLVNAKTINMNFESHIKGNKPVIVDFMADWCAPCKLMTPVLQEVRWKVGERATLLTIDIDNDPGYAQQYAIQSVPTLVIFREGNIVWRKSGVVPAHEILEQLTLLLV